MQTKLVCALLWSLALPASAWADIVAVSNLNNTTAVVTASVSVSGGATQSAAQYFETGSSSSLFEGVTLSLGDAPGGGAFGQFNVALYSDFPGKPNSVLQVLSGNSNPTTAGLYDYDGSYTLDPNTRYWIVGYATSTSVFAGYNWHLTGDFSETGEPGWSLGNTHSEDLADWLIFGGVAQMSVSIAAVPEASSVAFLGLASVLIGGAALARRKLSQRPA